LQRRCPYKCIDTTLPFFVSISRWMDSAYTLSWNDTEIEKLSIKLKVSDDLKLVIWRKVYLILCSFPMYVKCLKTHNILLYFQKIDILMLRTLSKNLNISYTCSEAWFMIGQVKCWCSTSKTPPKDVNSWISGGLINFSSCT
jgi:hypothetical protein